MEYAIDSTTTTTQVQPADKAFVSSALELPSEPPQVLNEVSDTSVLGNVLSAVSLVVILLLFKKIVNIMPSLFACMLRWKESVNLEASVKTGRDRTIIAAAMVIPFILVVENFNLYSPKYMQGLSETLRIAAIAATFATYSAIRLLANLVCKPTRRSSNAYNTGYKSAWTFFIMLTITLLWIGGIASFANLDYTIIKVTMLWVSAVIYLVLLLREFQIFSSSCSFITAFLYLCALEIVPTGLLVGSVFVF